MSRNKHERPEGFRRNTLSIALGTALLGAALSLAAPVALAQTVAEARTYAIASQPLGGALNRLAEAAGMQILVPPALVRNKTAPALNGRYTKEQALRALLVGSGLDYRTTSSGVITIVAASTPAPRSVPAAKKPAPKASAQTSEAETDPADLETVQVVGSRIKRAEMEGPSPITLITAEQIEQEGHATVFDALETLVMASGAVETELSGGFSANAHPLNLRGLGPGRSLLLIDGRRAADYPFPYEGRSNFQNFGNIPSGAVQSIEVLAGGASAIYGADAISGVVNVNLKKNYDGDRLKVRGGTSTMGGRDRLDVQWTGGKTGDNWGLTYAFQYYSQDILYGFQRDFWDRRANPAPNPQLGVQPVESLSLRTSNSSSANLLALPAGTCALWGGEFVDHTYRRVNSSGVVVDRGAGCGTWNNEGYVHLSKGKKELAGYVFGTWDLSDSLQGWASLQAWRSKAESLGGFETVTGPHTNGVGRRADFFDQQMNRVIAPVRVLTPVDLGGVDAMNQHYFEKSLDIAVGLRGTIADRWDWDLTLSRADYYFERNRRRLVGNLVNDFFFGPRLGTRPNGIPIYKLNMDHWARPLTPDEYASISTIAHYEAESWVTTGNFAITGDLFELPAGPVGVAAVLEASTQGYDLDSDPRVQPGVVELYNLTGTNGGGERDRYAAGIEFSIPILSTLKASMAGRFDKYDDITAVDDAKTYNLGLEWRPLDNLLVRGAYATSFKAPDMHWVFSEGSGSFGNRTDYSRCWANGYQDDCDDYVYSMFAVTEGDPNLEEERGKSWSAGLVWDITQNLSVTTDYWNIELNGAIERLSDTNILLGEAGCRFGFDRDGGPFEFPSDSGYCQQVLALVTRTPESGQTIDRVTEIRSAPINQSYLRVNGIDATASWRLDTQRFGDFRFSFAWSHTLKSERQVFATDSIDANWRDNFTNIDYRSRVRAGLRWDLDDWSAGTFMTRYGSLPNWQLNDDGESFDRTRIHFLWNVNVGRKFGKNAEVTLYVNNVFNKIHPHDPTFNSFPFFYDSFSPVGREVAVQFEYKFN